MEEENTQTSSGGGNKNLIVIAVAVIIIIALVAAGGFVLTKNKQQSVVQAPAQNTTTTEESSGESTEPTNEPQSSIYKDGTYTATGTYSYHSGTESIGVTVTLKSDVIEDVSVETMAKAPTSKVKQADFAANYKSFVVGKNIDEVKLTVVSGSSLTPGGFNKALEQIKVEAKS